MPDEQYKLRHPELSPACVNFNTPLLSPIAYGSAVDSPISAFLSPTGSSDETTSPDHSVLYEMDNYDETSIKLENTSDYDLLVSNTHQQHEELPTVQEHSPLAGSETSLSLQALIKLPATPKKTRPTSET